MLRTGEGGLNVLIDVSAVCAKAAMLLAPAVARCSRGALGPDDEDARLPPAAFAAARNAARAWHVGGSALLLLDESGLAAAAAGRSGESGAVEYRDVLLRWGVAFGALHGALGRVAVTVNDGDVADPALLSSRAFCDAIEDCESLAVVGGGGDGSSSGGGGGGGGGDGTEEDPLRAAQRRLTNALRGASSSSSSSSSSATPIKGGGHVVTVMNSATRARQRDWRRTHVRQQLCSLLLACGEAEAIAFEAGAGLRSEGDAAASDGTRAAAVVDAIESCRVAFASNVWGPARKVVAALERACARPAKEGSPPKSAAALVADASARLGAATTQCRALVDATRTAWSTDAMADDAAWGATRTHAAASVAPQIADTAGALAELLAWALSEGAGLVHALGTLPRSDGEGGAAAPDAAAAGEGSSAEDDLARVAGAFSSTRDAASAAAAAIPFGALLSSARIPDALWASRAAAHRAKLCAVDELTRELQERAAVADSAKRELREQRATLRAATASIAQLKRRVADAATAHAAELEAASEHLAASSSAHKSTVDSMMVETTRVQSELSVQLHEQIDAVRDLKALLKAASAPMGGTGRGGGASGRDRGGSGAGGERGGTAGGDPVRERALLGALQMTRRQLGQSNAALVRMALPPLPHIAPASRRVALSATTAAAPPLVGEVASLAKAVRAHCAAPRVVDLAELGRQRDTERARAAARAARTARWYVISMTSDISCEACLTI